MSPSTRPAQVVITGWLLVIVFGALVLVIAEEPASAAFFAGVGLVMALWVARRPGVAAFVVSLALGLLQTAEEITYLVYGLADSSPLTTVLADVVGLLGGLLVTGGSAVALLRRRAVATERVG
jgi:hypothetical protein